MTSLLLILPVSVFLFFIQRGAAILTNKTAFAWIRKSYGDRWLRRKISGKETPWKEQLDRVKPNTPLAAFNITVVYVAAFMLPIPAFREHVYLNPLEHGIGYFFLSILAYLFWYDFGFYVLHRFLFHAKWVYKKIHIVHHSFPDPVIQQRHAFSPWEPVLYDLFAITVMLVMPMNPLAVAIGRLVFVNYINILNHLGYEIFPTGFATGRFTKLITTPTHHTLHHMKSQCNYGLLINYDVLFGTQYAKYEVVYEEVVARAAEEKPAEAVNA